MYKAQFYKNAARYYKRLDVNTKRRINNAVDEIIKKIHLKGFTSEN